MDGQLEPNAPDSLLEIHEHEPDSNLTYIRYHGEHHNFSQKKKNDAHPKSMDTTTPGLNSVCTWTHSDPPAEGS
jgi:hypothetical protein